jgi:hypothetical protein
MSLNLQLNRGAGPTDFGTPAGPQREPGVNSCERIFHKEHRLRWLPAAKFPPGMPKKFASGVTKPGFQLCRKSDRVQRYSGVIARRCVPLFFRARGSHAANIQADADLHTFSSHHRDAVPAMRRADAAGFDRATRPQLQPADLSLCALRLRRELFEGDVNRRHPAPNRCQRVKALWARLCGQGSARKGWIPARMPGGKSRLPKSATRSGMPQRRPAR